MAKGPLIKAEEEESHVLQGAEAQDIVKDYFPLLFFLSFLLRRTAKYIFVNGMSISSSSQAVAPDLHVISAPESASVIAQSAGTSSLILATTFAMVTGHKLRLRQQSASTSILIHASQILQRFFFFTIYLNKKKK